MRSVRRALAAALVAAATSCYRGSDYSPTDPGVLVLTVDATSIPADGVSRTGLTVTITPRASTAHRIIAFSTTAGSFVGGAGVTATDREVTVDADGRGTIELQSSTNDEIANVTARAKDLPATQQQVSVHFVRPAAGDVIRFVASPASAPADGATVSTFSVSVPIAKSILSTSRNVTFQTTAGTLLPDGTSITVPLDATGTAAVQLRSPSQIVTSIMRATISSFTAQAQIDFTRAQPDSIEVKLDKLSVQPKLADSVTFHVQLRRSMGTVTAGAGLTFTAFDASGGTIGLFQPQRTAADDKGQAVGVYSTGDTNYRGQITIRVQADLTDVTGTAVLQVVALSTTSTAPPS